MDKSRIHAFCFNASPEYREKGITIMASHWTLEEKVDALKILIWHFELQEAYKKIKNPSLKQKPMYIPKCVGIKGKLFGHNFVTVFKERKSPISADDYEKKAKAISRNTYWADDVTSLIKAIEQSKTWRVPVKIYCKRCGHILTEGKMILDFE